MTYIVSSGTLNLTQLNAHCTYQHALDTLILSYTSVYWIHEMLLAVAKQTYVLLAASRFLGLPCCAAEQLMSLADTTI